MTTFAADHDTSRQLEQLDERRRTAWEDYRSSTATLDGSDYEEIELVSWERLQRALDELAGERARLVGPAGETPAGAAADDRTS
ncbi:MAG TPA: hypothetical protein VFV85_00685 [Conexibacter sp.]|nr:hypothetical protein [Conexibacter sp.]